MNLRIAKDVRLIAPSWLLTMALMIAACFLPHAEKEWAGTIAVFGCLVIAASIFGAEFGHGTIPQLLSQPVDRRRIWLEKMVLLAFGLGSLVLTLLSIEGATWPVAIVAAAAFCTVPFFTLLGRGTLSGIILSIPIPGIIFVVGALLALWLLRPSAETVNEERLHFWVRAYFYGVLPAYCAIVFYRGYRRFLNFEVAGREQPQVRLPASMQTRFDRLASCFIPSGQRHLRSLVAKELHLQHNATILFLVFVGLQLLDIAYIKLAYPQNPEDYFVTPLFFYSVVMPLLIGSSAIAEDTNLGTRAWHLTLPCSVRAQWFLKLSVVIILAIVFAIGVPIFWLSLGYALGIPSGSPDTAFAATFCPSVLLLALIAFYASSFSRDTLRALLTAFGTCVAIVLVTALGFALIEATHLPQHSGLWGTNRVIVIGWVLLGLSLSSLLFLLLRNSYKHFAALDRGRIWTNLLAVVVSPILLFFVLLTLAFLTL